MGEDVFYTLFFGGYGREIKDLCPTEGRGRGIDELLRANYDDTMIDELLTFIVDEMK